MNRTGKVSSNQIGQMSTAVNRNIVRWRKSILRASHSLIITMLIMNCVLDAAYLTIVKAQQFDSETVDERTTPPATVQDSLSASHHASSSSASSSSSSSLSSSSSTSPSSSSLSSTSSSSLSFSSPSSTPVAAALKPSLRPFISSLTPASSSLPETASAFSMSTASINKLKAVSPTKLSKSQRRASTLYSANSNNNNNNNHLSGPKFQAQSAPSMTDAPLSPTDPNHPCYNFTVGNEKLREFYSPNFPSFYPNNTECERVIKAPFGYLISIEFRDQFHLEDATNCEYDHLEIRDGAYGYSNQLAKLCGPDFPSDIRSTDQYLFLRFVSDDSIEYQGFRAVYEFERNEKEKPPPPHDCRFNISGVSGIIENREIPVELTNYSITQDVPIDCTWNITVAPGYKMYLNFKEYKLSSPNNCEANYIDIYGEKLSDFGRKQRFCGTQAEPVRSDGTHMNIRFFAKPEALTNVQFEITFTAFREVSNKEKCLITEFDCEDSTCIDVSLKCDGVDNCKYRYDEDKQTTCAPGNQGVLNLNSQHMVVILIVFCALVFGMCASITISCWSKIEERKERKREYKLRRSRETSMEGGLNRTMTITSLDRSTTGYVPEQHTSVEQASSSSGSRSHRKITTANAIRMNKDMLDEDNMDVVSPAGYYDQDENGCYVPDLEVQSLHRVPSVHHQHLIYPPSAERIRKTPLGNGQLYLDSPDTPTPPQMLILGSPNGGVNGTGTIVGEMYHPHQMVERDSLRSGSECSIPPPPPPPALSHFRNRMQQQQQQQQVQQQAPQMQYRAVPVDSQYRQQHMIGGRPVPVGQQPQQQIHHPDCAQAKLQQPTNPDGSLRRGFFTRPVGQGAGRNNKQDPDDLLDMEACILDEADGESENRELEHQDQIGNHGDDDLNATDLFQPVNGRLGYLMRGGSTLEEEEEDDSVNNSVPLTPNRLSNQRAQYGSYRSEAVLELTHPPSGQQGIPATLR